MNCNKGDLAIIVRSHAGNEGKIVTCLELDTGPMSQVFEWSTPGPRWVIDRDVPTSWGIPARSVADCNLRPLRGGVEHEVLRTTEGVTT